MEIDLYDNRADEKRTFKRVTYWELNRDGIWIEFSDGRDPTDLDDVKLYGGSE